MKIANNLGSFASRFLMLAATCGTLIFSPIGSIHDVYAQRIKDIAAVQGVRPNQLIGYGLVVGLDNTGDDNDATKRTIVNMLTQMGMNIPKIDDIKGKNAATVMVTASLPPYARPGQGIDITISALGRASSLRGGTLLMTPLKGVDGQVYAIAQGSLVVGGAGASAGGARTQVNHLNAGRIMGGAIVERQAPTPTGQGDYIDLEIPDTDFTTVTRIAQSINDAFGQNTAMALDGRVVRVIAPRHPNQRVEFLAKLENLNVDQAEAVPKVIINARTGSIVMNQNVRVSNCAISHGNLTITVNSTPTVSQPNPLSNGRTVVGEQGSVQIKADPGQLVTIPKSTSLNDVVRGLNAVGATTQDLIAILQAMKAAGALKAELQII